MASSLTPANLAYKDTHRPEAYLRESKRGHRALLGTFGGIDRTCKSLNCDAEGGAKTFDSGADILSFRRVVNVLSETFRVRTD